VLIELYNKRDIITKNKKNEAESEKHEGVNNEDNEFKTLIEITEQYDKLEQSLNIIKRLYKELKPLIIRQLKDNSN
jgi:hypothetical protein